MHWRFWEPRHTVESVAAQLAAGLADGSIVLDEPLADEPLDEGTDEEGLVLQMDLPDNLSDAEVLELVKQLTVAADEDYRRHGGQGLAIREVEVRRTTSNHGGPTAARVAFEPKGHGDRPDLLTAVAADLRRRPNIQVLAVPNPSPQPREG